MQNKKRVKTLILLTTNLLVLLGVMVSFTVSTMAYFTANREAEVRFNEIEVDTPGFMIDEYNIYPVTVMSKGASTSSFTFENTAALEMPRFDPQNIEYSKYMRALVVQVKYTFSMTVAVPFRATTPHPTFTLPTTGGTTNDSGYTSNIFMFTNAPNPTLTEPWITSTISYTNSNNQSFATVTPSISKVATLTLATITPGSIELWFVIEYNTSTLTYINNQRATTLIPVIYEDDIKFVVGA